MYNTLGEHIRQLRRQHHLTQTGLGGTRYSKSYVSAVERGSIPASQSALRFFAEQLNKPADYFEQLQQQLEKSSSFSLSTLFSPADEYGGDTQAEAKTLLDLLLAATELYPIVLAREIATRFSETMAAFPLALQARHAFLKGLGAQKKGNIDDALLALEQALVLSPEQLQPAVLDALGMNYYQAQMYETALSYHHRARSLLAMTQERNTDLALIVELHCGNDCRALGNHRQACIHYEQARDYLSTTHNMKIAGHLYLNLGYCIYAALYQQSFVLKSGETSEEWEHTFRQAVSFLVQSRLLYQASHDLIGDSMARLTQAMILLDCILWRRLCAQDDPQNNKILLQANSITLTDDIEEQCRQILVAWQDVPEESNTSDEAESIIHTALAYLIQAHTQRASLARLGGYVDTAQREASRAAYLCQELLDSLTQPAFSRAMINDLISLPKEKQAFSQSPSLPPALNKPVLRNLISQAEIYFTAAELAEELGRATNSLDYAHTCYKRANHFLWLTLSTMQRLAPDGERDSTYQTRCYWRCMSLLETRMKVTSSGTAEEASQELLSILRGIFPSTGTHKTTWHSQ